MSVASLALSLVGPAVAPIATIVNAVTQTQTTQNKTNVNPEQNLKGSINTGGGGGGGGSGCGKQAPCGASEKKTKSCGGGGGGCGGSKKSSCSPSPLKVVFKDINGKSIPSGNVAADTLQAEKQSSVDAPWENQSDITGTPYDLTSQGKTFYKWSTYEFTNVQRDLEVNAVYRNLVGVEESTNVEVIPNKISQDDSDKVQNFSDSYLNYKAGKPKSRLIKATSYTPKVTEYGKYNAAIDRCVFYVDTVTNNINTVFDILVNHTDDCIDWDTFNDLKKCLLNIQSTFVFQTRMSINLDLQDIRTKITTYTDILMEKARNGENIDPDIKEYTEELDLDLEFFNEDTSDRYKQFVESFNSYVDTINKCFTTNYINKL